MKTLLSIFLSLGLAVFIIAGLVSVVDDSLVLLFGLHLVTTTSLILAVFTLLMAAVVYGMMGLTPMVPKRLFLPIPLYFAFGIIAVFPVFIYCPHRIIQVDWLLSLGQVILGLGIVYRLQGGFKFRWPIVEPAHLGDRGFRWLNLIVFVLVNVFVVPPAMVAFAVLCGTLAINHFSGGFLAVHPDGLTVQVRKYVRNDGKTIQLIPMAHIGEADFYRNVAKSFPTNSIILMEGVTDRNQLITNQLSYKRAAKSLGLVEQDEEFVPAGGEMVMADVDVEQFSTNTLVFLNLITLIHTKGINAANIAQVMQYSPPPHFETDLFEDLLRKRNRRLLDEIQARLPESDNLIVPWGVGHMPEIAREIQASGFRLSESREYKLIRFWKAKAKTSKG